MDRKSLLIIAICIPLMLLWFQMTNKFFPPKKIEPAATNMVATAQSNSISQTGASPAAVTTTATTQLPVRAAISTNVTEETLVITNENARYTFTSRGGGLRDIALVHYPETITRQTKKNPLTNAVAALNGQAQVPVLAVLGDESVQGDGSFVLARTTNGISAEKSLPNGLRIVKHFQVSTNYLVHATVRLENSSGSPLTLPAQEWAVGTATPMGWDDDGSSVGLMWYDGVKNSKQEVTTPWFENRTLGCSLFPERLRPKYEEGSSNVFWAAPHNQFFVLAAMPDAPAEKIVSRVIYLPRPAQGHFSDKNNPPPKGYETVLVYPGATIAPGQAIERKFNLFAGPKEWRTLERIGDTFKNHVDLVMGFGGFFGFFAKILLLAMNALHQMLSLPYGWAIIAITVIIKLVFWPLTAISTRSSQKMAALAPQMTAIREKHKDDPLKMQQKMNELYREHKINPVAGCLPVVIQLPVFFGLFTMLKSAIELRGASFFWAVDLSKTDTLFVIPGLSFIPFISVPEGLPINLLPILYIASALWQTHMMPPSPGMDPAQQRLLRWMPLMFLAILYNFSSGLALYMTVNNLLTILQTQMMKKNAPGTPGATPVLAGSQTHSALTPASKKKK